MFVVSALVYPCALALLCTGAGLLVDAASGRFLPGPLLPAVGAAALIGLGELTTYSAVLAPATPYAMAALALAGFAAGRRQVGRFARKWRACGWQLAVPALAFAVALAPVLLAGRPTFSSYVVLTDSAFHMMGADYLLHHGQDYSHLDLRNSYGQYINGYYALGYPSGADVLLGGSSLLVATPLIWAFQPFNALMLAIASGPAWVLVRKIGLRGAWAAAAALTATVPALVYGYELVASVKEIVALAMILTLGALVALHGRWLRAGPTGAVPLALVLAAGVSALGAGFGAWGLSTAAVLAAVALYDLARGRRSAWQLLALGTVAGAVLLVAALGTWLHVARSVQVAHQIATTSNPGNLGAPLRTAQVFGTWLVGGYAQVPRGERLTLTYAIAALTLIAAVLGGLRILAMGERALAAWFALTVAVGLGLNAYATTWVQAKALVLTSPAIVILAWGGLAALRASARTAPSLRGAAPGPRAATNPRAGPNSRADPDPPADPSPRAASSPRAAPSLRAALGALAPALAIVLAGGVAMSDAMQYRDSDLAPTARYEELAGLNSRYAGRGPILFTDFDEYALYELRDLDVGGLEFRYPPAGLKLARRNGTPTDLDRVPPAALLAYPLIVTRRDPTVSEPPSAYRLVWEGTYYQVWGRRPGAPAAIAHLGLPSTRAGGPAQCANIRRLAQTARSHRAHLVAAVPPRLVMVDVEHAIHPGWRYTHPGLVMTGAGRLRARFTIPRAGVWNLWLKGQLMPTVSLAVDGRPLASIGAQLDGNAHNPDALTPLRVALAAGSHRLTIARGAFTLAPGGGGLAILHQIFLTPADAPDVDTLVAGPARAWRSLCGRQLDWVEAIRA